MGRHKTPRRAGPFKRIAAVITTAAAIGCMLIGTAAAANAEDNLQAVWKLATGVNAGNIGTFGADKQQNYYGTAAPACTDDGVTSFQVDQYKNVPEAHNLVNGGVLYLAPRKPNDFNVLIHAQVVTPPRCKPDQPAPTVTEQKRNKQDCDFYYEATDKTSTPPKWDGSAWNWVPDTDHATTTTGDWNQVKPTTPAEKKALKCEHPTPPEVKPVPKTLTKQDCTAIYEAVQTTTPTNVFNEDKWSYDEGIPVVTTTEYKKVRDKTFQEQKASGCVKQTQDVKTWHDCTATYSQTTTHTTVDGKEQEPTKGPVKTEHTYSPEEVAAVCPQEVVAPAQPMAGLPQAAPHTGLVKAIWLRPTLGNALIGTGLTGLGLLGGFWLFVANRRRRGLIG